MTSLFDPVVMGDLKLKNRVVMAPLTRCRSDETRVPNSLMLEYYTQRTEFGMIITEATVISELAVGYPDTPGIWSVKQIQGWKKITDAVHEKKGLIVMQLWHVGRISHPVYLNGELPVAPSSIQPAGHVNLLRPKQNFPTPRALRTEEVAELVDVYRQAAINAKEAGFDGVELHAANGYLIDQFLQSSTNQREDEYGGCVEHRCQFLLDIVDAVTDIWGCGRVGVHLSPRCDTHDMGDDDPKILFTYLAKKLGERELAFLFLREFQADDSLLRDIRDQFGGAVIANEKFTGDQAEKCVQDHQADAVAFGKLSIANPDLVNRLKQGLPLNTPEVTTFYGSGENGYIDYARA